MQTMCSTLETFVGTIHSEPVVTDGIEGTETVTQDQDNYESDKSLTSPTKNLLDIPTLTEGYTIVATENYIKEKKRRPLSLSSIQDLRIVKESQDINNSGKTNTTSGNRKCSDNTRTSEDRKQRIRTLMLASAALAKFKHHASVKRKEKKQSNASTGIISPRLPNQTTINDKKRLSVMDINELFDYEIIKRYKR